MLNKTTLQGRLTADIELKKTKSDMSFCEFTIAWSEKMKDTENKLFLRCKAWSFTADFLSKYFSKGKELIVEGQMRTEEWEKDGEKQQRTILNVDKVHFCGSGGGEQTKPAVANKADDFTEVVEEDLPF